MSWWKGKTQKEREIKEYELSRICHFKRGIILDNIKQLKISSENTGIAIIQIGHIINGKISTENLKFYDPASSKSSKEVIIVEKGDVIIMTRNRSQEKRRVAAINTTNLKFIISNELIRLTPKIKELDMNYLCHWLNNVKNIKYTETKNLDIEKFKKIKIYLPPLGEQQEISKYLDSFESLEENLKEEIKIRRKQYAYCMERLFNSVKGN